MGIYRDMLREEDELMGNTGFDQGAVVGPDDEYTVQLNDIAKTVEDLNDARADESEQKELDGQDLESNPVEECAIAIYESEHNWNKIFRAMGEHELHEAARGNDVVMEAVDVKAWFTKIKEWFVKKWQSLTGIVKKWLDKARSVFKKNKSFVEKYADKIRKGAPLFEGTMEGFSFKGNLDVATVLSQQAKDININIEDLKNANEKNRPVSLKAAKAANIRGQLLGQSGPVEADGFAKKMNDALFGTEPRQKMPPNSPNKDVPTNPQWIIDVLSDKEASITNVMKAYNDARKAYNNLFKELKTVEKAATNNSFTVGECTKLIAEKKEIKNAQMIAMTTAMKYLMARKQQALIFAHKYISAVPAEKKEKPAKKAEAKQESARLVDGGFLAGLNFI